MDDLGQLRHPIPSFDAHASTMAGRNGLAGTRLLELTEQLVHQKDSMHRQKNGQLLSPQSPGRMQHTARGNTTTSRSGRCRKRREEGKRSEAEPTASRTRGHGGSHLGRPTAVLHAHQLRGLPAGHLVLRSAQQELNLTGKVALAADIVVEVAIQSPLSHDDLRTAHAQAPEHAPCSQRRVKRTTAVRGA